MPLRQILDFEYVLFDPTLPLAANALLQKIDGATVDAEVNGWHYDITELSGERLVRLARLLLDNATRDVVYAKQVFARLAEAVASRSIPTETLEGFSKKDRAALEELMRVRAR